MKNRPFAMLDRDGTIIVERHYLAEPRQVELIPGAADGLHRLVEMGFGLVVVTNQSGIGRGYFDRERVDLIHRRMSELLTAEGVRLDGIYFCPHRPEDDCDCRKPRAGLIKTAAEELGFDPQAGVVIGDNVCDIELGRRIGATTLLVRTGYGAEVASRASVEPDVVVDDLSAAAQFIQRRPAPQEASTILWS